MRKNKKSPVPQYGTKDLSSAIPPKLIYKKILFIQSLRDQRAVLITPGGFLPQAPKCFSCTPHYRLTATDGSLRMKKCSTLSINATLIM